MTVKTLEYLNVDYKIVIEPQEYDDYNKHIDASKILTLPFSNLGLGGIPARNWVWEHSLSKGESHHWILDDNISHFYRFNRNMRVRCNTPIIFKAAEDFVDRYENVMLSGFNYRYFAEPTSAMPPFYLNTRINSCILINNSLSNHLEEKWRGKFNEDTDLSIRTMKAGFCTILFNAFLCGKTSTLTMKGGNTDAIYKQTNKREEFADSLVEQHPDIARKVWRYNRWHHEVNYDVFKKNKLILKDGLSFKNENNEYGMKLVDIKTNQVINDCKSYVPYMSKEERKQQIKQLEENMEE